MTSDELRLLVNTAVSAAVSDAIDQKLAPLNDRLDKVLKQRNFALVTALLCLLAGGAGVIYAITSRVALKEQAETNNSQLCSSAQSSALAFREPQISSSGVKEPQTHFLDRMLQQRETLRGAGDLNCTKLRGYAKFDYLRGKALVELDEILHDLDPQRFHRHRHLAGGDGNELGAVLSPSGSAPVTSAGGADSPATTPAGTGGGNANPNPSPLPPKPPKSPPKGGSTAPTAPAGAESPATITPITQQPTTGSSGEPQGGSQGEEADTNGSAGVIGDPGGFGGEVVCTVNKLGIRICTE